jgi:crossover junction endodeoxyribonuclease RusA
LSRAVVIELPWPVSINRYWRRAGTHIHISNEGREYRAKVARIAGQHNGFGTARIAVEIEAFPPDRRKRDLDNLLKVTLDALQAGRMFADDAQVDELSIARRAVVAGGSILVKIREA